ncbi:MAG: hypothetical protein EPO42_06050 [Gallionellaceae bacterium]|nr:MAG: hypothetical protein EPO42_06050 [Gallionellaceae bacterium]
MSHPHTEPAAQNQSPEDKPVINFDLSASMADIERRLEEARRSTAHERIEPQHPPLQEATGPMLVPPAAPAAQPGSFESGFLAELAREAAKKQGASLSATQALQARSQSLHDALGRIAGFFTPLIQFANNMEPDISRSYRLDARTAYSNLKWRNAHLETRKQDLSATALLAHITFSVNYCAPEPVLVTRPWNQLDALKAELNNLKLRPIDESELDGKRPKQEWLQVRLAPDFPVHLRFLANYDKGHIDVLSRNLLAFGISSFRLQAEDVTSALLDDLGRVLLSRADKLPAALLPL